MFDLLPQASGLVLLVSGLWFGYSRWVKPRKGALDVHQRGLLLLLILALMGGLIGSPFWWMDMAWSFAYDLPALASRMLASAGWSFVMVCFLALQRPVFRRLRLVLLLLLVYLAPLAAAIFLFDLDRFDLAAPLTYAFFGIVIIMVFLALWYLRRQPHIMPEEPRDSAPARPVIKNWLAMIASLTGAWGLALFVTDNGPWAYIWVWPGDVLSSRLIGVMLLAIAVGAAYSRHYADVSRLILAMVTTYSLGLALASFWNILAGKPIKEAYLVTFAIIFLGSGGLLFRDWSTDPLSPFVSNERAVDDLRHPNAES